MQVLELWCVGSVALLMGKEALRNFGSSVNLNSWPALSPQAFDHILTAVEDIAGLNGYHHWRDKLVSFTRAFDFLKIELPKKGTPKFSYDTLFFPCDQYCFFPLCRWEQFDKNYLSKLLMRKSVYRKSELWEAYQKINIRDAISVIDQVSLLTSQKGYCCNCFFWSI